MTSIFAGDLATGLVRVWNLPVISGGCTSTLNAAGQITATVRLPTRDPYTGAAVDVSDAITPGKSYLAYEENGVILNAGPVWNVTYDMDAGTWTLQAAGIRSYFDHRFVLPVLGTPAGARTAVTSYTGLDLRTIAKKLVQQAQSWSHGGVPMTYEVDVTGTSSRNYDGYAMHRVGQALADLTNGGPDIDFRATVTGQYLSWAMVTGNPELTQAGPDRVFDTTVPYPTVRGVQVTLDATTLVTDDYEVGATPDSATDTTTVAPEDGGDPVTPPIIGGNYDSTITTNNFLRMEESHSQSTINDATHLTLDAITATTQNRQPTWAWKFQSMIDHAPLLGSYATGDYARIAFQGNPIIPDGQTRLRITSIEATLGDNWATITATPDRTAG